jgi:hypothetical protein
MMESRTISLLIAAALILAGAFFVPQMLRLRILVLRKLRLNWFADLHENYFDGWVIGGRIFMSVLVVALVYLALA